MKPSSTQPSLPYLKGYSPNIVEQIARLINENRLGEFLFKRYPERHDVRNNKALYLYVQELKSRYLKQSPPISKAVYDDKIHIVNQALGLHTQISRVQGGKLKTKNEIRIGAIFRDAPPALLRMICVHELAHLREKTTTKPSTSYVPIWSRITISLNSIPAFILPIVSFSVLFIRVSGVKEFN